MGPVDCSAYLGEFADNHNIKSKGALCVVLVLTRLAEKQTPPYEPNDFLTPKGGQVAGLGRGAVQSILGDYGITRTLAEEGGRTSRGSIQIMRSYIGLLNTLSSKGPIDFSNIEKWWIERVNQFFSSLPLKLKIDASKSLRSIVSDLMALAYDRQREMPGTMIAGAVMEHLVGAKLEIAMPKAKISHKGFSVADSLGDRGGDFQVEDTIIHVTTAPSEALIRKCEDNLNANFRPVVITTQSAAGGATAHAKNAGIEDRFDILEIDQFIATNIYEWSGFIQTNRKVNFNELVDVYNRIVKETETDPSLLIAIG